MPQVKIKSPIFFPVRFRINRKYFGFVRKKNGKKNRPSQKNRYCVSYLKCTYTPLFQTGVNKEINNIYNRFTLKIGAA